jgi:hypothetical protein
MDKRSRALMTLWMTGCILPSDPDPGPILQELLEKWDGAVASYCACSAEDDNTQTDCEKRSTLNEATRTCLMRAVERVDESSQFLQCMLDVERAHERCVAKAPSCEVVENCETIRTLDRFTCVLDEYPSAANGLSDACPLRSEGDPAAQPAILFPFGAPGFM